MLAFFSIISDILSITMSSDICLVSFDTMCPLEFLWADVKFGSGVDFERYRLDFVGALWKWTTT